MPSACQKDARLVSSPQLETLASGRDASAWLPTRLHAPSARCADTFDVVHCVLIGQRGQADGQYLLVVKPSSMVVNRQIARWPAGHRYSFRLASLNEIAFVKAAAGLTARSQWFRNQRRGTRTFAL